jgi:hypothetical protein
MRAILFYASSHIFEPRALRKNTTMTRLSGTWKLGTWLVVVENRFMDKTLFKYPSRYYVGAVTHCNFGQTVHSVVARRQALAVAKSPFRSWTSGLNP